HARSVASIRSCASGSCGAVPAPELSSGFLSQELGCERLREVGVRAEQQPALSVALRALSRNQQYRRAAVLLALAHELHELEPVDVRHVAVGDHEIPRLARQTPARAEPTR